MKKELIIGLILGLVFFIFISNKEKLLKSPPPLTPSPSTTSSTFSTSTTSALNPKLIADAYIDNLEIEGIKYVFDKGEITREDGKNPNTEEIKKIRQLVFFYLETLEDPLFTAPDFNTYEFQKSISLLEAKQKEFLKILGENKPFFPIGFLKTVPIVYQKEGIFLSNPSEKNAKELAAAYQNTALKYKEEAENFVSHLKNNQKNIRDTNYVLINTFTTKKIFFKDLEKIVKNAKELEKEIDRRKTCLEKGLNCDRYILTVEKPKIPVFKELKFSLLTLGLLFPSHSINPSKIKGPFAASSSCWGLDKKLKPQKHTFYLSEREKEKISFIALKLATTNYYRKVGTFKIDEDFQKTGLERVIQIETNYYLCTDLEYQAELITIFVFLNKFRPLFGEIEETELDKAFLDQAKDFESSFFSSEFPSYENLKTLSNLYIYAYKTYEGEKEVKNEFLQRYLLINRKLADIYLLLNNTYMTSDFIFSLNKKDPQYFKSRENAYSYLYPFRSLWNLLYFPYSPSFWRINEKLEYLEKKNIEEKNLKNKTYISYQEALKEYGEKEIKKWHETYKKIVSNF